MKRRGATTLEGDAKRAHKDAVDREDEPLMSKEKVCQLKTSCNLFV
jgi:hypothetical protein